MYASHRQSFTLLITLVVLLTLPADLAQARRAYSYGSDGSSSAAPESSGKLAVAATKDLAPSAAVSGSVLHKAAPAAKKVPLKKHADGRNESGTGVDEDSILNVFAPAPIDTISASLKTAKKTNEKSAVVVRDRKKGQ